MFEEAKVRVELKSGEIVGESISEGITTIGGLKNIFENEMARRSMLQDQVVYRVLINYPVADGTAGGLFFGTTFLSPGLVGDEYFMTKGHFHQKDNSAEYYWCIKGHGVLLLLDHRRNIRAEEMVPGSLHYIGGGQAHRVVNTGEESLVFGACWPSDAGHDYQNILKNRFPVTVKKVSGKPVLFKKDGCVELYD